jgi:hypothetical protein
MIAGTSRRSGDDTHAPATSINDPSTAARFMR